MDSSSMRMILMMFIIIALIFTLIYTIEVNPFLDINKTLNNNNETVCINNQYGVIDADICTVEISKCIKWKKDNSVNSVPLAYMKVGNFLNKTDIVYFLPYSKSSNNCNKDDRSAVINKIKAANKDFKIIF